jgi:hypothetical protein
MLEGGGWRASESNCASSFFSLISVTVNFSICGCLWEQEIY